MAPPVGHLGLMTYHRLGPKLGAKVSVLKRIVRGRHCGVLDSDHPFVRGVNPERREREVSKGICFPQIVSNKVSTPGAEY